MGLKINLYGNPLNGVFSNCNDHLLLVPKNTSKDKIEQLTKELNVQAVPLFINRSSILGCFTQMNNSGIITSKHIFNDELKLLEQYAKKVVRLPDRMTAAGNIILANDTAAMVHPDMSDKALERVAETLDVDVKRGTISGLGTVGKVAVATNAGILVPPGTTEEEIGALENLFNLPIDIGTINFGSSQIGSGIIANSHGYATGINTTGPEIGRIEDALGYL